MWSVFINIVSELEKHVYSLVLRSIAQYMFIMSNLFNCVVQVYYILTDLLKIIN